MKYALVPFLILALVGCRSQKQPSIRYYTLELPVQELQSAGAGGSLTNYKCEIRKVEINPAFSTHRIASREASNALSYYAYHQWAARPTEMLTQLTELYVQSQELFAEASTRSSQFIPDYTLHIYVHRLESVQSNEEISARLSVEFHVKKPESDQADVYYAYDEEAALSENSINAFASAISKMYGDALGQWSQKMRTRLESN